MIINNNEGNENEISFDGNGYSWQHNNGSQYNNWSQYTVQSGSNNNGNILLLNQRNPNIQRDPNMRKRRAAAREAQRISNRINQVIEHANNANFIRRSAREADQHLDHDEIRTPITSRKTSMASGVHSNNNNNVREIPYNNFNEQRPIDERVFQNKIQKIVQATISKKKQCYFTRAGGGGNLLNTRWPWQYGSGWIKNVNEIYAKYVQGQATQREVINVLDKVPDGCCLCGC